MLEIFHTNGGSRIEQLLQLYRITHRGGASADNKVGTAKVGTAQAG